MLPPRNILILMIAVSLVMPLQYLILAAFPPPGYVFTGGVGAEDGARFFEMISPSFGLKDPWDTNGQNSILYNPLFNSPAFYVPSGLLLLVFQSPLAVFSILRFVFSFLLLLVSYDLINIFLQKNKTQTFLLFIFGSGIGGILYFLFSLFTPNAFTSSYFAFLYDITRTGITFLSSADIAYWTSSLFFGYLALKFFIDRKYYLSGLGLGISILIHLTLGIGFGFLLIIYWLIYNIDIKKLITALAIAAPFAIYWLVLYIQQPFFFDWYKVVAVGSAFAPSLIIAFGVIGVLVFYYMQQRSLFNKWLFLGSLALITVAKLSQLIVKSGNISVKQSLGQLTQIANGIYGYSLLLHIPMLVVLASIAYRTYKSDLERGEKFILTSLTILLLFVLLPEGTIFSGRYFIPLWLPMIIAASYAISYLSEKYKIEPNKIFVALLLISLPSVIMYNALFQEIPRHNIYPSFYQQDEFAAINFLKAQPDGNVMSSFEIGSYLPFYTGKRTLFGSALTLITDLDQKITDYNSFYGNATDTQRLEILDRYHIQYVFFGINEKKVSGYNILDGKSYLKEIFSTANAKVYRVNSGP